MRFKIHLEPVAMMAFRRTQEYNAPLVALQSFRSPKPGGNPFVALTLSCFPAVVTAVPFSWRRALFGRYDLLHIHWPEALTAGSSVRGLIKKSLSVLLIVRISLLGTIVVRTVHNPRPHEPQSLIDRRLHERLEKLTTTWIALNRSTPQVASGLWRLIPHGHYRDWFANFNRTEPANGQICFAGLIREYKNVPGLIRAFTDLAGPELRLLVAGNPRNASLEDTIRRASNPDRRISFDLRALSDAELVEAISSSELIVLPYHDLHNSGTSLLALSLDRPILVPRNEITDALAAEVGEAWVLRYDPPISSAVLAEAMDECSVQDYGRQPNLDERNWDKIGRSVAALYIDAIRSKQ